MNSGQQVVINTPGNVRKMAAVMNQADTRPELEIFDTGDLNLAIDLIQEGLIKTPTLFTFVMGVKYGFNSHPRTLHFATQQLPPGSHWAAFGIGRDCFPILAQAYLLGGHVRVGLEDNIYLSRGVLAKTNAEGNKGFLMNLTSETDFVAKNEDFIKFGLSLLDTAVSNDCKSLEEFLATKYEAITVGEKLIEQVGVIGEKIEVTQFETITSDSVVAYNHAGYRVAVLVGLNKNGETIIAAGKDVAMQIAAMNPLAVNAESVSPEVVAREKAIIMETMQTDPKMAGKPEEMLNKIAEGKIGAFFKENTLLAQAFVKDGSKSVEEFLNSVEKELTVTEFKRLNIG